MPGPKNPFSARVSICAGSVLLLAVAWVLTTSGSLRTAMCEGRLTPAGCEGERTFLPLVALLAFVVPLTAAFAYLHRLTWGKHATPDRARPTEPAPGG